MQTIRIGSNDAIQAPPANQPELPGQMPTAGKNPAETGQKAPTASPEAIKGTVSEQDALKTVKQTEISTLMPLTGADAQSGQAGNPGASVPLGGMLDSALAVELMDALIPALAVVMLHYVGMSLKKADLQLTAREKTTLEPIVKQCLNQLMINFSSPFAALGVSLVVIYGAKIGEKGVVQMLDNKAAKNDVKKQEQATEKIKQDNAPPVTITKQSAPIVNIAPKPSANWEPTEEMIFEGMKRDKSGRAGVIERLKRERERGTLQKFLSKKPYGRR